MVDRLFRTRQLGTLSELVAEVKTYSKSLPGSLDVTVYFDNALNGILAIGQHLF